MRKKLTYVASACLLLTTTAAIQAAELTLYPDADTWTAPSDATAHGADEYLVLHGAAVRRTVYVRFNLGAENVTSVQSATLTMTLHGSIPKPPYRNDSADKGRFSLYGLNNVAGNTAQNWDEATLVASTAGMEIDWTSGAIDIASRTLDLDEDVAGITETLTNAAAGAYALGTTFTVTGEPLVRFLQSRVDDDGLVTFIIRDEDSADRGFGFCSKEYSGDETYRPKLEITATTGPKSAAINPSPLDGATEVSRDAVLSWTPGVFAVTHDVYFGTDSQAVANGAASVLVGSGQDANSYDPPGHLDFGQTYYWRVDEVNGAPDFTLTNGSVWSFTVEQYSYPVTGVTAEASSFDTGAGPENTVNGSGLDATGLLHSTLDKAMWVTSKTATFPHWIMYTFDKVYKLDQMWVWNYNMSLESVLGIGCKDVQIEYSLNGTDWTVLSESTQFNRADSADNYAHNTTVDFAGVAAQYVKLTISSNWGGILQQAGLSEVRFFYIPVSPSAPSPATATANVDPRTAVLSWRAGREAASHELYLSTDQQAVTDGTAEAIPLDKASYSPPSLQLESTYYWKVVEVNQAETPSTWTGDLWSLSTRTFLTVDDFESYTNDSPNRVFQTWIDGSGFSADDFFPNGNSGNGTGSLVGYDPLLGNIMETDIVYGGRQSMPLYYDNSAAPRVSEAVRTFESDQDWSKYGITTLVLYFRGDVNNVSAPVYVKINNTKVLYNSGLPSTATEVWKQWNIDLAQSGANLKAVKSLTIGVGDGVAGGTGTIYLDDILLYMTPPPVATPVDPGTNGLAALYSMEDNVDDTSDNKLNGTLNGNANFVNSKAGFGKALSFDAGDGTNDYVDLPFGSLISTMSSGTFATWVYFANTGTAWQRIFDFGNSSTTGYMFLTQYNTTAGRTRFAITQTGNAAGQEQVVNGPAALPIGWHHLAVVIDGAAMTLRLYQDGIPVASGTTTVLPKDLGVTTNNWLGRSQYSTDPYFTGSIDDLRIFNRALSEGEVRYLAGDR
jgi:hypothetical protein